MEPVSSFMRRRVKRRLFRLRRKATWGPRFGSFKYIYGFWEDRDLDGNRFWIIKRSDWE